MYLVLVSYPFPFSSTAQEHIPGACLEREQATVMKRSKFFHLDKDGGSKYHNCQEAPSKERIHSAVK